MDESRLAARVDAPVEVLGTVANTTDRARELGRAGASHGTFVVAESLTAARGRTGADWSAPPGGVWSSTLLRPDVGPHRAGRLTIAGGLATCEAVRAFGVDAAIEWPNDVVAVADDGTSRKLAGVLTEVVVDEVPVAGKPVEDVVAGADADDLQFVVLGVGIDADLEPSDLSSDRAVTTMRAELAAPVDPTAVAAELHGRLLARCEAAATDDGFAALLADWRAHAVTLGESVRAHTRDGQTLAGRAVDVTDAGALVVEGDRGRVTVTEGEVQRVRRR